MKGLRWRQIAEPSPTSLSARERMFSLKWFCDHANENPTYACLSLLAERKPKSENIWIDILASNVVL